MYLNIYIYMMIHHISISNTFCESSSLQQVASSKHPATIWKKLHIEIWGFSGQWEGSTNPAMSCFFCSSRKRTIAGFDWGWYCLLHFFLLNGKWPWGWYCLLHFCILLNGKWLTSHLWRSPWNFVGELFQPGPRWKELVASSDRFFALFSSRLGSLLYPKNPWIQWKFFFHYSRVLWGGLKLAIFGRVRILRVFQNEHIPHVRMFLFNSGGRQVFETSHFLSLLQGRGGATYYQDQSCTCCEFNLNFILGCLGSEHFLCRFFARVWAEESTQNCVFLYKTKTAVIDAYFLKQFDIHFAFQETIL